ncbi:MAG TPA: TolC family protein [Kofleriaceae bacterium]|jgi:outer membrane protein TolC
MTRLTWLAALTPILVATTAAAQPKLPAPTVAAPPPDLVTAPPDDFDKQLDELFSHGGLTSDQAAKRAGAVSPDVQRKVAEIDASIAEAEQIELQRVPQVIGKGSYTRLSYIAPVVIPFGGQNFTIPFLQNNYLLEGSINVPLSDYLLRYPKLVKAARLGTEAARVARRQSEISAGEDARLAYYEWVRSRLQVLVAKRQLAQVQTTLAQMRALAEVQRLSRADLMRFESQEAESEQTVDQLENITDLREEQLRILIGADANEQLSVGEDIRQDLTAPSLQRLEDALQIAKQQRLDFRSLDVGIEAKDKQSEAELSNQLPRLSAFGVIDYADPNQRIFPQEDAFKFTWSAGVQLQWTLSDTLTSRETQKRLDAETRELVADRANLERGTKIELLQAQQAVSLALHDLQTTKKGLDSAAESYRVRQELLANDRATAVELVDAETDLTRARIAALNARVDLRVAVTQLAHALGNDTK